MENIDWKICLLYKTLPAVHTLAPQTVKHKPDSLSFEQKQILKLSYFN